MCPGFFDLFKITQQVLVGYVAQKTRFKKAHNEIHLNFQKDVNKLSPNTTTM